MQQMLLLSLAVLALAAPAAARAECAVAAQDVCAAKGLGLHCHPCSPDSYIVCTGVDSRTATCSPGSLWDAFLARCVPAAANPARCAPLTRASSPFQALFDSALSFAAPALSFAVPALPTLQLAPDSFLGSAAAGLSRLFSAAASTTQGLVQPSQDDMARTAAASDDSIALPSGSDTYPSPQQQQRYYGQRPSLRNKLLSGHILLGGPMLAALAAADDSAAALQSQVAGLQQEAARMAQQATLASEIAGKELELAAALTSGNEQQQLATAAAQELVLDAAADRAEAAELRALSHTFKTQAAAAAAAATGSAGSTTREVVVTGPGSITVTRYTTFAPAPFTGTVGQAAAAAASPAGPDAEPAAAPEEESDQEEEASYAAEDYESMPPGGYDGSSAYDTIDGYYDGYYGSQPYATEDEEGEPGPLALAHRAFDARLAELEREEQDAPRQPPEPAQPAGDGDTSSSNASDRSAHNHMRQAFNDWFSGGSDSGSRLAGFAAEFADELMQQLYSSDGGDAARVTVVVPGSSSSSNGNVWQGGYDDYLELDYQDGFPTASPGEATLAASLALAQRLQGRLLQLAGSGSQPGALVPLAVAMDRDDALMQLAAALQPLVAGLSEQQLQQLQRLELASQVSVAPRPGPEGTPAAGVAVVTGPGLAELLGHGGCRQLCELLSRQLVALVAQDSSMARASSSTSNPLLPLSHMEDSPPQGDDAAAAPSDTTGSSSSRAAGVPEFEDPVLLQQLDDALLELEQQDQQQQQPAAEGAKVGSSSGGLMLPEVADRWAARGRKGTGGQSSIGAAAVVASHRR